jgi:hypothetical protein
MTKTTEKAISRGATTETDFRLFANLVNLRTQFEAQLAEMTKVPTGIPPPRGILLRYDFFLERGRFYQAQSLPKGFRRRKYHAAGPETGRQGNAELVFSLVR